MFQTVIFVLRDATQKWVKQKRVFEAYEGIEGLDEGLMFLERFYTQGEAPQKTAIRKFLRLKIVGKGILCRKYLLIIKGAGLRDVTRFNSWCRPVAGTRETKGGGLIDL